MKEITLTYTDCECVNWHNPLENSLAETTVLDHTHTLQCSNFTPRYISNRNAFICTRDIHKNVHRTLLIIARTLEITRWKTNPWYIQATKHCAYKYK